MKLNIFRKAIKSEAEIAVDNALKNVKDEIKDIQKELSTTYDRMLDMTDILENQRKDIDRLYQMVDEMKR